MDQKSQNKSKMITKVSLVIYCLMALIAFIIFLYFAYAKGLWNLLYGFLLCLGPGLIFILVSLLIPSIAVVSAKLGKAGIVWFCVGYVLKYGAIIGIPFIGMVYSNIFDKWVMMATTLVAPIQVLITKLIFANFVSKSDKKTQK